MMRPISTPLLMGGFEPEIADFVAGAFRDSGFTPIITGAASPEVEAPTGPCAKETRSASRSSPAISKWAPPAP